jgi:integrase
MKQFINWMVTDRRMPHNPLVGLSPANVQKDRRHDRRALDGEELSWLIFAARNGKRIEGISGPDRAMLYVMACWTGYRRKELAAVTQDSLDLESNPPTVTVPAAYTKNGRSDTMPLHPVVVDQLQAWLATKPISRGAPLFELKSPGGGFRKTHKMMRKDLEAARKAWIEEAKESGVLEEVRRREGSDFLKYRNSAGLYADFHANRHTFITNLGRAGIHPKLAQHSTINLTMTSTATST